MILRSSGRRTLPCAVALTMLLGAVVACGADDGGGTPDGSARPGNPTADAVDEIVLPIDAYALSTVEVGQMGRVRMLLAGECMRGFGFDFDARSVGADDSQSRVQDVGTHGNRRRYGVTEEAVAARYGYHLASTVAGDKPAGKRQSDHGFGEMTAAKEAVLFGRRADGKALTEVSGRQVPAGGCFGEASSKISNTGELAEAVVVSRIASESFERSLNDSAVTAAISKWSACMKAKGHTYPNPLDAAGAFDLDTPTVPVKEITAAKADVQCKREVGLVDTWMGFETRYQKAEIEKHAEELRAIKSERAKQMKRIAEILALGS